MTLNEYQQLALRTSRNDIDSVAHLTNGCLGLAGEAGECADLLKKALFQDGREIKEKMIDELGDVLWYVSETATALGIWLDQIAERNIEKLKKRYPEGFDPEKSLHRKEDND